MRTVRSADAARMGPRLDVDMGEALQEQETQSGAKGGPAADLDDQRHVPVDLEAQLLLGRDRLQLLQDLRHREASNGQQQTLAR